MNIEEIIEYLKKAGLNENVAAFIKKDFCAIAQAKKIIDKTMEQSFGLKKDEVEKNIVSQLRKGNETFCITANGGLWMKDKKENVKTQRQRYVRLSGQLFGVPDLGEDDTIKQYTDYTLIEDKDGRIMQQTVLINEHNKNGEQYYSGSVEEKGYNYDSEIIYQKRAMWSKHKDEKIPDEELYTVNTTYKTFAERSFQDKRDDSWENQSSLNSLQQRPQSISEKFFQDEMMKEAKKRKTVIDRIKSFFTRSLSKEHEEERGH